ncbi:MAG: hypothetical protein B6U89_07640 [Desulfurococcales archaeon ex4484_58]|nr:MAG: hypothetical protein B6U89_07640 [Desulfurococcales archaeon ex4484_58]
MVVVSVFRSGIVYSSPLTNAIEIGSRFVYVLEDYSKLKVEKYVYKVVVEDKFVSSDLFFNITYYYTYGDAAVFNTTGVSALELSQYIPSILEYDIVRAEASRKITVSVPVPIDDWNPLITGGGPFAYKTLDLTIDSFEEYVTNVTGGEETVLKIYRCSGYSSPYSVEAIVERYTGLLLDLKFYDTKTNTLVYHLYLSYTNLPRDVFEVKSGNENKLVPVISVIGLGMIGVIVVYVLLSRVSKGMG